MNASDDLTLAHTIGCNIKKLRVSTLNPDGKAWLQKECAETVGATQPQWAAWEAGKNIPGDEYLRAIATMFGVAKSSLWSGDSPPAAAGGGQKSNPELIEAVFQLQETLSVFGQYLAAGKSADVFPEIGGLLGTVRKLQERLGDLRQLPENHDRTA